MKKEVIQAVAGQIANMINNNIVEGCGNEHFEDWCEDGEVFDDGNTPEEFIDECMSLVREVAPIVDNLTFDYFVIKG